MSQEHEACCPGHESLLVRLWLAPVRFYRRYLSPLKGRPTCRYLPTCSEYAIEAVQTRGVLMGSLKSVGRLLRCNPLFAGGYDPVQPLTRAQETGPQRERCKD